MPYVDVDSRTYDSHTYYVLSSITFYRLHMYGFNAAWLSKKKIPVRRKHLDDFNWVRRLLVAG